MHKHLNLGCEYCAPARVAVHSSQHYSISVGVRVKFKVGKVPRLSREDGDYQWEEDAVVVLSASFP